MICYGTVLCSRTGPQTALFKLAFSLSQVVLGRTAECTGNVSFLSRQKNVFRITWAMSFSLWEHSVLRCLCSASQGAPRIHKPGVQCFQLWCEDCREQMWIHILWGDFLSLKGPAHWGVRLEHSFSLLSAINLLWMIYCVHALSHLLVNKS